MGSRHSYDEGRELRDRVFGLLEIVFPGLTAAAARAEGLGAPWESVSTPFVLFEGDAVVAHVGRIDLPLVVDGCERIVGSIHAVATHPDRRGRGLFRRLMEDVIADSDGLYETLVLTTETPAYYEPFGFRVTVEHEFGLRPSARATEGEDEAAGVRRPLRPLDLERGDDAALLLHRLDVRAPVSRTVGVVRERAIFCFNESRRPLLYDAELDAIVVCDRRSGRLDLFDIVAPEMPSLARLLARLGAPETEDVRVHFAPDQLGMDGRFAAIPRLFEHDGPSYLMVRGRELSSAPFSLPRSART